MHLVYNRLETFDAAGVLVDTVLRKVRLRWCSQDQFAEALGAAGFRRHRGTETPRDGLSDRHRVL